jgi:hypothetical protein
MGLKLAVLAKDKQDSATQAKDTVECYDSAKQRTGIDWCRDRGDRGRRLERRFRRGSRRRDAGPATAEAVQRQC